MSKKVVLVDEQDVPIGTGEKEKVHREGRLHRAFSVFVFDAVGRLLLQQRAQDKYHSAGLWSNTCCSHPRPGEAVDRAAHRRLEEEMGFTCRLRPLFSFIYRTELENGLIEHEFDHVFVGQFDGQPTANPAEVAAWKWIDTDEVYRDLQQHPDAYTYWFKIGFERLLETPPSEMAAA